MTNTNVDRLVEEFKERAKYHTFNSAMPSKAYENVDIEKASDWLRTALSQARQEGRGEEREKITGIVEEWMKTSNPSYAQDLFDALTTEGK